MLFSVFENDFNFYQTSLCHDRVSLTHGIARIVGQRCGSPHKFVRSSTTIQKCTLIRLISDLSLYHLLPYLRPTFDWVKRDIRVIDPLKMRALASGLAS